MSNLAAFIMKGRIQAVLCLVLLTVLSWMLSLASLLAAAALALPTLRKGGREGGMIAAMAFAIVILAGGLIIGEVNQVAALTGITWFPVMAIALILRTSANMGLSILGATGIGILAVIGIFGFVDDPGALWTEQWQLIVNQMAQRADGGMQPEVVNRTMAMFSRFVTGGIVAGLTLSWTLSLMLARWWQAGLYNPGGFRAEFVQLRMPQWAALGFLGLLVLAVMDTGLSTLAINIALPMIMTFLVAGFSVLHAKLSESPAGGFWLAGIYIGLLFIPPLIPIIALVGLSDPWLNWRQRFISRAS